MINLSDYPEPQLAQPLSETNIPSTQGLGSFGDFLGLIGIFL